MNLYSYVIVHDTGFAPNPFGGYCTLGTCKPSIRRRAQVGDWIIGTGSKATGGQNRLVYAMRVSEKLTFENYNSDPRFAVKQPVRHGSPEHAVGDNKYYRLPGGKWMARDSDYHMSEEAWAHDLSGLNVLVGEKFYYFGGDAVVLPQQFEILIKKGPGDKSHHDPAVLDAFVGWLETNFQPGLHGMPYEWEGGVGGSGNQHALRLMSVERAKTLRSSRSTTGLARAEAPRARHQ